MVCPLSWDRCGRGKGLIMHMVAARPGVLGQSRPGNRFTHPLAHSQSQGYQENRGY